MIKIMKVIAMLLLSALLLVGCSPKSKEEIVIVTRSYTINNVTEINDYLNSLNKGYTIKVIDGNSNFIESNESNRLSSKQHKDDLNSLEEWDLTQSMYIFPGTPNIKEVIEDSNLIDLNELDLNLKDYYPDVVVESNRIEGHDYIVPGYSRYSFLGETPSYYVNKKMADEVGIDLTTWNEYIYQQETDINKVIEYYGDNVNIFDGLYSLEFSFPNVTPLFSYYNYSSLFVYNELNDSIEFIFENEHYKNTISYINSMIDMGIDLNSELHNNPFIIINNDVNLIDRDNILVNSEEYIGIGTSANKLYRTSLFGLGVNKDTQKKDIVTDFLNLYISDKKLAEIISLNGKNNIDQLDNTDYYSGYGNLYNAFNLDIKESKINNIEKSNIFSKTVDLTEDDWKCLSDIISLYEDYMLDGRTFYEKDYTDFGPSFDELDIDELLDNIYESLN